jgi:hypothetical protein
MLPEKVMLVVDVRWRFGSHYFLFVINAFHLLLPYSAVSALCLLVGKARLIIDRVFLSLATFLYKIWRPLM